MKEVSVDEVIEVVATILQVETGDIEHDCAMDDIEAWDSIKSMEIVLALEEEYEVYFSETALESMIDIPSIVENLNFNIKL